MLSSKIFFIIGKVLLFYAAMKDNLSDAVPLALIVCDTVITDAATGKKTLVGIFNAIGAQKFPHVVPQLSIFASLTNLEGETEIKIRMIAGNSATVLELPAKVPFRNLLDAPEIVFNLQNLRFPAPGTFELQLLARDEVIASRLLVVSEMKAQPGQSKPQQ